MKKEIWKDIKGYEGLYQVSNLGNVKSLNYRHQKKEKVLKPGKNQKGYLFYVLCKNGIKKNLTGHYLVLSTFCPNHDKDKNQINHKNEIKTDNRLENLEWCDANYNNNYGTHNLRISITQGYAVLQYDLHGNVIQEFHSLKEVERQLGFCNQHICDVCNGKRKTCGGYIWKYKSDTL